MYIIANGKRIYLTEEEMYEAAHTWMDLKNEDDRVLILKVGIYRDGKEVATLTHRQLRRAYYVYMESRTET